MKMKRFANFVIPAIGQGAGGNDVCDDEQRLKVIRCGIDLGVTLIDTAEVYRNGHSEEVVGRAIKGMRNKVFISTKFSPEHNRYDSIIKALEGSLRRLKTDYVDLYQVHWPNPAVPIEETMKALTDLQISGKVRHIGVSNFSLQNLILAQDSCSAKIEFNQFEYNLLERGIEEDILPYCEKNGIMTIAYNPLLHGNKGAKVLESLAKKYEKAAIQIVLNWLASHDTVVPIPKTLNLEHMRENATASDFELEKEDIAKIDNAFKRTIIHVPTNRIRILPSRDELVYTTMKEALENKFNLTPSPSELAKDILNNAVLKPIRLKPAPDRSGKFDYELTQGRIRYWAWIIAYGSEKPIPAYVME